MLLDIPEARSLKQVLLWYCDWQLLVCVWKFCSWAFLQDSFIIFYYLWQNMAGSGIYHKWMLHRRSFEPSTKATCGTCRGKMLILWGWHVMHWITQTWNHRESSWNWFCKPGSQANFRPNCMQHSSYLCWPLTSRLESQDRNGYEAWLRHVIIGTRSLDTKRSKAGCPQGHV